MELEIIKKRASKYNFVEIVGEFYRDNNSKLIKKLNEENKNAFFGIENSEGIYTVVGEEYLYFSTSLDTHKSISNSKFLKITREKLQESGKESKYEFIKVDKDNTIWILNTEMLFALSSLLLFLTRTDGYGIKPKV